MNLPGRAPEFALALAMLTAGCNSPVTPNSPNVSEPGDAASVIDEIDLRNGWQFYRYLPDSRANLDDLPETGWQQVSLPHTANLEPRIVNDQWQGDAIYRLSLQTQPGWLDNSIWLRFEGAMSVARVFLNGALLAEHKGGYLPFTVDLTGRLLLGSPNELLVHLDNRDQPLIGPKPHEQLDFSMYGGLYREVRLFVRDTLHITDEMLADRVAGGGIFVTYPTVSEDRAEIDIRAHVANRGPRSRRFTVRHDLRDGDTVVAAATSEALELAPDSDLDYRSLLTVPRPRLWSPQLPNLYELETIIESDGAIVDQRRTRIGVRRVDITADGFRINGKQMFLRGVNRHQEYPYIGYALSRNADYRDAKLIKEAGFDYVRLSHYPHSRHFMRAADELGLVVLNAILGWQYYNPDSNFSDHVVQTCRDLIRRDRNHASVIAWECSLNESPMPPELITRLHEAVHAEYPGDQAYSAGWVPETYDIYLQARQHRLPHLDDPIPEKPYVVSEYGDWEYYAQNAGFNQDAWEDLEEEARTSRQLLAHGEQRLLQQATNVQEAHNDNLSTPAFADGYWVMFDYNRGYADDLEASGLMSLERFPKPAYHFFRSQRDAAETSPNYSGGPTVYIANEWRPESTRDVRVFSNGAEVELFVNGRSQGRRTPDADRISGRLRHPPFTFPAQEYQSGFLEAVAYDGEGNAVASHRRSTPGQIADVETVLATRSVEPSIGDAIFVHARLIDEERQTVPFTGVSIRFALGTGLELIGPDVAMTENGVAATLVRVVDTAANLAVMAEQTAM